MNLVRGPLSAKLSLYTAALMQHDFGLMLLAVDSFYNKADLKSLNYLSPHLDSMEVLFPLLITVFYT